ncbi:hypothetical protein H6F88_31645 [Oculatella sp. FACHB-28]|uniref:hypothetical protein n=1 Tax=Oculatella sp. FACHB-28 TaxID=2692845 RepID=UPI0016878C92|nr:hypothetical protein [Oculatella sp. FACHB-28]MBD2060497.1 hypothetical protein [Oculatella sp. FACHB-28]
MKSNSKRGRNYKNAEATLHRAFQQWLQGKGLRDISTLFSIPSTTLSYSFRRLYGRDYKALKNTNGILPIIQEHLANPKLSSSQRRSIEQWKDTQLKEILLNDLNNKTTRLLTAKEENQLTFKETSHTDKDWRDVL